MLNIIDLSAGYGSSLALRHVSLQVPAAGVTALTGPNGCGKSTLLKAILRFLPACSGTARRCTTWAGCSWPARLPTCRRNATVRTI